MIWRWGSITYTFAPMVLHPISALMRIRVCSSGSCRVVWSHVRCYVRNLLSSLLFGQLSMFPTPYKYTGYANDSKYSDSDSGSASTAQTKTDDGSEHLKLNVIGDHIPWWARNAVNQSTSTTDHCSTSTATSNHCTGSANRNDAKNRHESSCDY